MTGNAVAAGAAVLAAALAAAAPGPLRAETAPPEIGASFTGAVPLAGKQVALPEGSWTLVARGFAAVPELRDEPYGAVESLVLFRLDGRTVDAFVMASANLAPVEEGWGIARECVGEDVELPLAVQYDAAGAHTFCGFAGEVRNVVVPTSPDAWKRAAVYGKAQGLVPARTWLMAGYRLGDRHDVIDVRYHFNPILRAGASASAAVARDEGAAAGGLAGWLDRMREPVRLGFHNGLAGVAPLPMPWTAADAQPSPVTVAKLAKLARLRQDGVLDERRYRAQEALILAQRPRTVATPISNESMTLIRTLIDGATAAAPTYVGNLLVLQNPFQAVQLLGVQSVADFAHDFGIEWAWNTYGPQRLREVPTLDLPVAGALE